MAIPETPLSLELDGDKLTLEELAIFDTEEAQENPLSWLNKMRRFLIKYSTSWTPREINHLESGEIEQVTASIIEALQAALVPKASLPSSKTGQE